MDKRLHKYLKPLSEIDMSNLSSFEKDRALMTRLCISHAFDKDFSEKSLKEMATELYACKTSEELFYWKFKYFEKEN